MSRLLLATNQEGWEARVRASYDHTLNGELRSWGTDTDGMDDAVGMLRAIEDHGARVVALGPGFEPDAVLEAAARLDRDRPEVCVLLVAEPTPELYRKALRVGVRDIVDPDAELQELRAAFDAAIETAERREVRAEAPARTQHTIAVVSPKGGAGKTAIASNLAIGLAAMDDRDVVIVDLDVQFGDVANALRLAPEATILDAVRIGDALDITTLKAFLTPHPSGAYALCAPATPAEADAVNGDDIVRILRLLATEFGHVAAMEAATDIVLVCGTDVASARAVRKEIDAFDLLGFMTQRRHLVLNRADARVGLSADDIEGTVGMSISVAVPSSRSVPLSMNQGIPLLEGAQKSPVSRSYGELVNRFADTAASKDSVTASRSRWRKDIR
jgi:pilus assembly protein CpaE